MIKLGHSIENTRHESTDHISLKKSFLKLIKLKALWLLGLCMLFRLGATLGVAGYLPLYLRDRGWSVAAADGSLSIFYVVSTALVVPISVLSDKIGSRKALILPALFINILTTALIPVVSDGMIWVLVILSGAFIDGFMAIIVTMLLETEGIGAKHSGMAVGILFTIAQVGSLVSPPLGNGFASISSGLPFYFWAGLAALSFIFFIFVHETGHKKKKETVTLLRAEESD
jgi:MFS family permease